MMIMITCRCYSTPFIGYNQLPLSTWKPKQRSNIRMVRCALYPQERRESRRLVCVSLLCICYYYNISVPDNAVAGVFDKYMKRKKLDPLEAYVPAIILTQLQIEDLGKTLDLDQPQYAACRNLLRSGPAASLRVNIRAVAQYAADAGYDKTANNSVDQCLSALEELDSLLLRASRNDQETSIETMKSRIVIVVGALDSLLQTVPSEVLNKGKAIAEAYLAPEEPAPLENVDPELKQLESIL